MLLIICFERNIVQKNDKITSAKNNVNQNDTHLYK